MARYDRHKTGIPGRAHFEVLGRQAFGSCTTGCPLNCPVREAVGSWNSRQRGPSGAVEGFGLFARVFKP